MTGGRQAIGLDVGGTKIAAARVGADGSILAGERVPSPAADPAATLEALVTAARAVRTDQVEAVGIGAAGLVDSASSSSSTSDRRSDFPPSPTTTRRPPPGGSTDSARAAATGTSCW
jgi:predicted NBD/HSP70 family sugar kinase